MERYVILNRLGSGSQGIVWLVSDIASGELRCLKEFDLSGLDDKERIVAMQEVALLSSLQHKHVLTYMESFFKDKDTLCMITEYCAKGDLNSWIKEKKENKQEVKEEIVWKFLLQAVAGLSYVHSLSIIHRDVKTMNLFINDNEDIKVGDFGVARILSSKNSLAHTLVGTPLNLSPEQIDGKTYDEKSDVWSLGCCLYEMLTLQHPFEAQNPGGVLMKILKGKYAPISSSYSLQIRRVTSALLQVNHYKRPNLRALLSDQYIQQKASELQISFAYNIMVSDKNKLNISNDTFLIPNVPKKSMQTRTDKTFNCRLRGKNKISQVQRTGDAGKKCSNNAMNQISQKYLSNLNPNSKLKYCDKVTKHSSMDIFDHHSSVVNLPDFFEDHLSDSDCSNLFFNADDFLGNKSLDNTANAIGREPVLSAVCIDTSDQIEEDLSQIKSLIIQPLVCIDTHDKIEEDLSQIESFIIQPHWEIKVCADNSSMSDNSIVSTYTESCFGSSELKNEIIEKVGEVIFSSWMKQLSCFSLESENSTAHLFPSPSPSVLVLLCRYLYSAES